MGRCSIHRNISVEVTVVEIRRIIDEEEVDEVHLNISEAANGILAEGGASTSLHQPCKTNKPSAGIVE